VRRIRNQRKTVSENTPDDFGYKKSRRENERYPEQTLVLTRLRCMRMS